MLSPTAELPSPPRLLVARQSQQPKAAASDNNTATSAVSGSSTKNDNFDLNVRSPARRTRSMSPTSAALHDNNTGNEEEEEEEEEFHRSRDRRRRAGSTPATTHTRKTGEQDEWLLDRRKHVVRTSWRAVQFGLDVQACEIFYTRLFDTTPSVRSMFPDNMKVQYQKLYATVSLAVEVMDQPDALLPVLRDLGRQHAKYGVVREHYDVVVDCFLWTLHSYISSKMPNNNALDWMHDVTDAWDWVLTFIGKTMADAADEEMARLRDEEEARLAVEETMRLRLAESS